MNRRSLLRTAALSAMGLAALPLAWSMERLSVTSDASTTPDDLEPSEPQVIDEIVALIDNWESEHPGTNVRASLLTRLRARATV